MLSPAPGGGLRGAGRHAWTKEKVTELLGVLGGPGSWPRGEEAEDVPGGVLLRWQKGREDLQLGLAPGPHLSVALPWF